MVFGAIYYTLMMTNLIEQYLKQIIKCLKIKNNNVSLNNV